MASRIQSLGNVLQTNTTVSPKSLVSGGNRQHLMEHCPGSPSPLLRVPWGIIKKKINKKNKKRRNWRETRRGEGESSVKEERDSTRWIMQSCQRRLLLEVLAVLKRARPDLHQPYSINHSHSPWLRAVWSVLRQMANNKMRRGVGRGPVQGTRWQVDCLGGTRQRRQARSLLPLFTEVTDGEIWADMYSSPGKYNYRTKP